MLRNIGIRGLTAMLAIPVPAEALEWQLHPADDSRGTLLTFHSDKTVKYQFECLPDKIAISQVGVTKLMNPSTGGPVGDGPGTVMPRGATMMALFAGKGSPKFIPAEAVKNPANGWDLTIELPKSDKQLKAVGKSDMISLFTTGYTMAVPMDADARAKWNAFMQQCNAAP